MCVVVIAPLPSGGLGGIETAYAVVDVGLVGLAELEGTAHVVHLTVLDKTGAGLVESERNALFDTLSAEVEHPVVLAGARLAARFAPCAHLLDGVVKVLQQVDALYQWRRNDGFVLDGQLPEDGQAVVGHGLIFDGAAHQHIVVAVAPVGRDALHEAVYTFGEEVEPQVGTLSHHGPAFRTPSIGILQQEVGGEAGENHTAGGYLVALVATAFQRQIEVGGFAGHIAAYLAAVHLVLPIDIAVFAARADFGAAVPRVPVSVYVPVFAHGMHIRSPIGGRGRG